MISTGDVDGEPSCQNTSASRVLSVFVSHSWSSEEQYYSLAAVLNSISDLQWRSVSVLRQDPLRTETAGEPAQKQELKLQHEKLQRLNNEYEQLPSTIRMFEEQLKHVSKLRREVADAEESMFSLYMTRLLEKKHGKSISDLRAMANANLEDQQLQLKLQTALHRRGELEASIKHCERRIKQIRADSDLGVHLIRYGPREIMYEFPKVPEEAMVEDRNLVLMLEGHIARADVVMVIAEMFAQYRKWMACELALAQSLGRPVLAVLPYGQLQCPNELKVRVDDIVPWDSVAIGKALLALQGRRMVVPQ